jgi:hypothetical protein
VVTNRHPGGHCDLERDVPIFLTELNALVAAAKPNYILMLGGTVKWGSNSSVFVTIFDTLARLNLPVLVPPGNDGRCLVSWSGRILWNRGEASGRMLVTACYPLKFVGAADGIHEYEIDCFSQHCEWRVARGRRAIGVRWCPTGGSGDGHKV